MVRENSNQIRYLANIIVMVASVSVRDVVAFSGIELAFEVSDDALGRSVRWVQATELTDPGVYLRPDELVCTVGARLGSEEASRQFAQAVVEARGAGIAFGLGDVHDQVPQGILDVCRESGLPLLMVPAGLPFLTISEFVIEHRLAHERRGGASAHELQRTVARERVGELVRLIGERLASPEALRVDMVTLGLDPERFVLAAFPAGASSTALGDLSGWLVGETPTTAYALGGDAQTLRGLCESEAILCGMATDIALPVLARSVRAARRALDVAVRERRVVVADELVTLTGLLDQVPWPALAPFVDRLLTPLRASDPDGVLVETLREFIEHNRSVEHAAKASFVHVNTVRHRLARVREVTGRDPFDFDDLVALRISLWAGEARGELRR